MVVSPSRPHRALGLLAVCLGTFMLIIDVQIVVVALPSIRADLGTDLAAEQWTIDAYSLTLAALLLPAGSVADIVGRRRVFAVGLALFTAGSVLCGLAASGPALVAFRALQGIGGATVFATSLALLAQTFEGRALGRALGVWSAVVTLGLGCGPVVGGLLTEVSWRWIFFVNLPLGVAAIVATLAGFRESRSPEPRRIDVPGGAVFAVGLVALTVGLTESGEVGWGSPRVLLALAVAAAALVAFPLVEHRRRQPMVDLALLRRSTFVGGLVAALGMNGSLYAVLLYLVLYLQDGLGESASATGLQLLVLTAAAMVTSLVAGRLAGPATVRWLIGAGLGLVGVGLLLMRGPGGPGWEHLVPGLVVAGAGGGLVNPALAATAVGVVGREDAGMASGINAAFRQIGITVSVAVLGWVFASHGGAGGPLGAAAHGSAGLDAVLLVAAGIALVAALLAVVLVRRRDVRAPPAGGPEASSSDRAASVVSAGERRGRAVGGGSGPGGP
jgi:EmrB/QacA subfamily drug resistance transporter